MKTSEVCFVCGSKGASSILRVRPNDDGGAYFSFLESHVPPRGARRPNSCGEVSACSVCCAFLNQQWDAFERSRTPLIRRLYWLKRIDNGTFTGAEMSLQGEYVAQLMGLHGGFGSSGGAGAFDCGNHSGIPCRDAPSPLSMEDEESCASDSGNGVLDLSVTPKKPDKQKRKKAGMAKSSNVPNGTRKKGSGSSGSSIVCYVCGTSCPSSLARFIYAIRPAPEEPYFPFLLTLAAPQGAMPLTRAGVTQVCADCRKSLTRQWRIFESRGTAVRDRTYHIGDITLSSSHRTDADVIVSRPRVTVATTVMVGEVCYLCAEPSTSMEWISTKANSDSRMVLPFVAQLKCPTGARPIATDGRAHVCKACYEYFTAQWRDFDEKGALPEQRTFLLRSVGRPGPPGPISASADADRNKTVKAVSDCPLLASALSNGEWLENKLHSMKNHQPRTSTPQVGAASLNDDVRTSDRSVANGLTASKYCFICGVEYGECLNRGSRQLPEPCELFSEPVDCRDENCCEDSKTKLSIPFFPFLKNLTPALKAEVPRSPCGKVYTCAVCCVYLKRQWCSFEKSPDSEAQNRWIRKYRYRTFECDVCRQEVDRHHIVAVTDSPWPAINQAACEDFTCLVCLSCHSSLKTSTDGKSVNSCSNVSQLPPMAFSPVESNSQNDKEDCKTSVVSSNISTEQVVDQSKCNSERPSSSSRGSLKSEPSVGHESLSSVVKQQNTSDAERVEQANSSQLDSLKSTPDIKEYRNHQEDNHFESHSRSSERSNSTVSHHSTSTDAPSASLGCSQAYESSCSPAVHNDNAKVPLVLPPSVDPILARLANSGAKFGLGLDSTSSLSSLLLMHNYLLQQQQQQQSALVMQYPSWLASYPPLINSVLGQNMFNSRPLSSELFGTLQAVEQSYQQTLSCHDAIKKEEDGVVNDHLKRLASTTVQSSTGHHPIFHRPFLDSVDVASDSSKQCSSRHENGDGNIDCESSGCGRDQNCLLPAKTDMTSPIVPDKPLCSPNPSSSVVHSTLLDITDEQCLPDPVAKYNGKCNANVDMVDVSLRDRRLSAALGLISLAHDVSSAVSDTVESEIEDSESSSAPSKRQRMNNNINLRSMLTPSAPGDAVAENAVILPVTSGACVSSVKFVWPGVEAVIEAYVRHLDEERLEHQCLVERQQQLESEHNRLVTEKQMLTAKLMSLQQDCGELEVERTQLQTTVTNLKNSLKPFINV